MPFLISEFRINGGVWGILLFLGGKSLALIEHHVYLLFGALALLWLRNWRYELGLAAEVLNFLRGLPSLVEVPVFRRAVVGRVQNGALKKGIVHWGRYDSCGGYISKCADSSVGYAKNFKARP